MMFPYGSWQRILHDLNLDWLVEKVDKNEADIRTKQDKLTAGANITIDDDNVISATGGGGGSTYTAGDGIDITNDVISVINPVGKDTFAKASSSLPVFYIDDNVVYKLDGTLAVLSDYADLGNFDGNITDAIFNKIAMNIVSGVYMDYDFGQQTHVSKSIDAENINTGYQSLNIITTAPFDEVQSKNIPLSSGGMIYSVSCLLGLKNGHLYLGFVSSAWGGISTVAYLQSLTSSFETSFISI